MVNPNRMSARAHLEPEQAGGAGPTAASVWVLDDPRAGTSNQVIGIAEQLGVPFRRIGVSFNWMAHAAGLGRRGSLRGLAERGGPLAAAIAGLAQGTGRPHLVISSGSRSAAVALWLKDRLGCRIVHCMRPGLGGLFRWSDFDLLVVPEHDAPRAAVNVFPVLGAPHRVSQSALRAAGQRWNDRLDHLPQPVVALLVGGPVRGHNMEPARAHALGVAVARAAAARGGSVVATTSRRTGTEATDALAAGLGRAMHLIYRWGEPGENPYLRVSGRCRRRRRDLRLRLDDERGLRHQRSGPCRAAGVGGEPPPAADREPHRCRPASDLPRSFGRVVADAVGRIWACRRRDPRPVRPQVIAERRVTH